MMVPPQSVRMGFFASLFIMSIMWTAYEKWDTEVIRADTAEQALAPRSLSAIRNLEKSEAESPIAISG